MEEKLTIVDNDFVCRICQDDNQTLILPCRCKTTRVHRECLQKWRYTDPTGERFYSCEVCKHPYQLVNSLGKCSVISYYLSVFSLFVLYMSVFCSICFSISLGLGYIFSSSVINTTQNKLNANEITCRFLLGFSVLLCIIGAIGIITYFRQRQNESSCFIYTCEDFSLLGFILACIFFIFGIILGVGYTVKITSYFFSKAVKITEQCIHTNIWQVADLSNEISDIENNQKDVVYFHQDQLEKQLL